MELYYYKGQPTEYSVEKDGRVYSHKTNQYMKGTLTKRGYRRYLLTLDDGHKVLCFAHRMVMETYCPNKDSENLHVNHKDRNPDNNNLENLEWVSPAENVHHAYYGDTQTKIYAYDENKQIVKEWPALRAVRADHYATNLITYELTKHVKHNINGYYWSIYPNDDFEKCPPPPNTGKARPINQYTLDGKYIQTFKSRGAAAKAMNVNGGHITECCQFRIPTYLGYIWRYADEFPEDDMVCSHT